MYFLLRISFIIFIPLFSIGVFAQDTVKSPEFIYGLDPVLHNGKLYNYYPPAGTAGNQYFSTAHYPTGSISIRGITYDNLRLNYDVFHQQLIYFYKKPDGSAKTIIVSDAWLDAFTMGENRFILRYSEDSIKHIYQEIGNGKNRLLYSWRKDWILDPSVGAYVYLFTPVEKEMFLFIDNKLMPYKNNSSFVKLFEASKQNAIKKYIRQNRIRIKKADGRKMTQLMDFINSLTSK